MCFPVCWHQQEMLCDTQATSSAQDCMTCSPSLRHLPALPISADVSPWMLPWGSRLCGASTETMEKYPQWPVCWGEALPPCSLVAVLAASVEQESPSVLPLPLFPAYTAAEHPRCQGDARTSNWGSLMHFPTHSACLKCSFQKILLSSSLTCEAISEPPSTRSFSGVCMVLYICIPLNLHGTKGKEAF